MITYLRLGKDSPLAWGLCQRKTFNCRSKNCGGGGSFPENYDNQITQNWRDNTESANKHVCWL